MRKTLLMLIIITLVFVYCTSKIAETREKLRKYPPVYTELYTFKFNAEQSNAKLASVKVGLINEIMEKLIKKEIISNDLDTMIIKSLRIRLANALKNGWSIILEDAVEQNEIGSIKNIENKGIVIEIKSDGAEKPATDIISVSKSY